MGGRTDLLGMIGAYLREQADFDFDAPCLVMSMGDGMELLTPTPGQVLDFMIARLEAAAAIVGTPATPETRVLQ